MSDRDVNSPPKSPRGYSRERGREHPTYLFSDLYNRVPELTEGTDLVTYDRMRSDPNVIAAMRSVELPILRGTYDIQPPSDPTEQERMQAETLKKAIFEYLSWPDLLRGALTYLSNGFSIQEFQLEQRGDYVLPRRISYRPPNTIQEEPNSRDRRGRLRNLTQSVDGQRYELPRRQLIICSFETPSPEYWRGKGLLYAAYKPWYIKEQMEIVNSVSQERWAAGLPMAEMPESTRPEQVTGDEGDDPLYDLAVETVKKLHAGTDSYAVAPPGWKISILDRKGRATDPLPFIKELKEDIYTSILAGHLKLGGADTTGSKALGVTFVDIFLHAVQSWGQGICDAYNRDLLRLLVDINWGKPERYPFLTVTNIFKTALQELAYLIQTNAIPRTPELVRYIYEQYGIRITPEDIVDENEPNQPNGDDNAEETD